MADVKSVVPVHGSSSRRCGSAAVFQLSSNMNAFPLINRLIVSLLPKISPAESGPPATFIGVNKASLGFRCIRTICPSARCHASLTTFPASKALMVSAVLVWAIGKAPPIFAMCRLRISALRFFVAISAGLSWVPIFWTSSSLFYIFSWIHKYWT